MRSLKLLTQSFTYSCRKRRFLGNNTYITLHNINLLSRRPRAQNVQSIYQEAFPKIRLILNKFKQIS